jgi:predicted F0F1-ATPase subunit
MAYNEFDLSMENAQMKPRAEVKKKKPPSVWKYLGQFGGIGTGIVIPITAGAIIGANLDKHFGSRPWWTLGLMGVGFVISVINLIFTMRAIIREGKQI